MEDDLKRMTWSCIWSVCQLDSTREYAKNIAKGYDLAAKIARSLGKHGIARWL